MFAHLAGEHSGQPSMRMHMQSEHSSKVFVSHAGCHILLIRDRALVHFVVPHVQTSSHMTHISDSMLFSGLSSLRKVFIVYFKHPVCRMASKGGWRASTALEKESPEKKRLRNEEAEGNMDDGWADEGTAGGRPSQTGLKGKETNSSGKAAPSKYLQKGKGKGARAGGSKDQIQLFAKAILSSHDAVRELQCNLGYTYIFGDVNNTVMAAYLQEGFYDLEQKLLKENKNEPSEAFSAALRKLGLASASQFAAVIEILAKEQPQDVDSAKPFWGIVKKVDEVLKGSDSWERACHLAGTWQTKKAHGDNRKIVAMTRLSSGHWSAVIFLLKRAGLVVHTGQKAPRDGLHRAVQGLLL